MLGKLIKYDFRSCWKRFWPIWLAILGTTLLSLPMMRAAVSLEGGLLRFLARLPFPSHHTDKRVRCIFRRFHDREHRNPPSKQDRF